MVGNHCGIMVTVNKIQNTAIRLLKGIGVITPSIEPRSVRLPEVISHGSCDVPSKHSVHPA